MPLVSVILPVYNAERFLREAIDSILTQTFRDFELILLNDGSTDGSEAIIQSYQDKRIVYLKNEKNEGLVYTLNKGIDTAKGQYIARMDADDVAVRERLERQLGYLRTKKDIGVVASAIQFINEKGALQGPWALDAKTITPVQIRSVMARECCIAHPSVMARSSLMKRFKYNPTQKNIEDYDLWLRMMNGSIGFAKIDQPLLWYRIHPTSITQASKQTLVPHKRIFDCKKKYLQQLKQNRFSRFNLKVVATMFVDYIVMVKKTFL